MSLARKASNAVRERRRIAKQGRRRRRNRLGKRRSQDPQHPAYLGTRPGPKKYRRAKPGAGDRQVPK